MRDESITLLKYAITMGLDALCDAYDTFESMDRSEKNKYFTMVEELAEQLSLTVDELLDH